MGENFKLGGELGGTVGEGSDFVQDLSFLDLGVWSRYSFDLQDGFAMYVAGAAGVTAFTSEVTGLGEDVEFSGTGFHYLGGVGATYSVSQNTQLIGGLFYAAHSADELEGAGEVVLDGSARYVDLFVEDVSVSNLQLHLGAMF